MSNGDIVRRVRRRPRAVPRVPARDGRLFRATIRSSFSSRRRTSSSIPIRSRRTCAPSTACRRRTRCSTRSTQRGLDKWNGSFFCGSAALLRRSALEEAGGFSGVTITEDCETAFELHARGWTSVFVDKPLIAGLQPETFASFIGQRVALVPGHAADHAPEEPAVRRRASSPSSSSATCRA